MLYAARTLHTIGNHSAAAEMYRLLAARSAWDAEIYHARVMLGVELKALGGHWQAWHTVWA